MSYLFWEYTLNKCVKADVGNVQYVQGSQPSARSTHVVLGSFKSSQRTAAAVHMEEDALPKFTYRWFIGNKGISSHIIPI